MAALPYDAVAVIVHFYEQNMSYRRPDELAQLSLVNSELILPV